MRALFNSWEKVCSKLSAIDILFLLLILVFVIFIYHFPDLFPLFVMPKGMVYLGHVSYFDPWDTNLYVSVIHYGQWGGILLPNQYTSIPNNPILIYSLLTVIGFIFHTINPFLLFHLSSIIGDCILMIGMFVLIRKIGLSPKLSLFSLFTISLGGGIGFLGWGKLYSADIVSSLFTFYTTFLKFHEAIGVLAFIGSLSLFYLFIVQNQQVKHIVPILILLLISVCIYPYIIVSFFLIAGIFVFIYRKGGNFEKEDYVHFSVLAIPSAAVVLFLSSQISSNPTFIDIGRNLPVEILPLLAGYGILIAVFLYQLFFLPKTSIRIFLSMWFFVVFILGILPIGPGKVFLRGSFFPITLVCILSLSELTKHMQKARYVFFFLFAIFLVGSSIYIFCSRIQMAYTKSPWIYMSANDFAIFAYLQEHTPKNSSVLSLMVSGNQIPAFTKNTVFLGHTMQTPEAAVKQDIAVAFFLGEGSVASEKDMLKTNNISYVLLGRNDATLYQKYAKKGNSLSQTLASFGRVFQTQDISLYKVQ